MGDRLLQENHFYTVSFMTDSVFVETISIVFSRATTPAAQTFCQRKLVEISRIELLIPTCKAGVLPLALNPHKEEAYFGFRPAARKASSRNLTTNKSVFPPGL